eukprot:9490843-Pyramimonas_sp.AAC.1
MRAATGEGHCGRRDRRNGVALRATAALPGLYLRRGDPQQRPSPTHPMGRKDGRSRQGRYTLGV